MSNRATIFILATLLQPVLSINHQMLTDMQQDKLPESGNSAKPGVDTGGSSFFDTTFFAPLPTKPPTAKPTNAPTPPKPTQTPQPVVQPTRVPTKPQSSPPKPVNPPTFPPAPVPVLPAPTVPPTTTTLPPVPKPISPPIYPDPSIGYHEPAPYAAPKPITYPTQPQVKIDTRTSSYKAEWGAATKQCEYLSPNVFFSCHDGGIITVFSTVNAVCRKLSDDYIQCRQKELWFDSYAEFTCTGIKHSHLMVTANVGPSPAWNCAKDGNAVKYLTISRTCYDSYGYEVLDKQPACEVGQPWSQGDVEYCASAAVCKYKGEQCKTLELGSVTMGHRGKDLSCSRVDLTRDLQNYGFRESFLRSVNQVDWRFSGMGRGCQWEASPLLLRCENGGQLDFLESYKFCQKYPEDNMAVCHSFAPFSTANEETKEILVSCTGKNEDQLILTVEIPSEDLDVRCKPEGIAIQSIMLSRGCGKFGTTSFGFKNDAEFCVDPTQLFVLDENRSYCFVGDTCKHPSGCDNLQLPVVSADTGTDDVGHCIYAV